MEKKKGKEIAKSIQVKEDSSSDNSEGEVSSDDDKDEDEVEYFTAI